MNLSSINLSIPIFFISIMFNTLFAQVKVGLDTDLNTPNHPTAILEVVSTNKGFLPPRLTQVQRDAITAPAEGLTVYNITESCINVYNGTVWTSYCEPPGFDHDWYEVGTTTAPDNINDAIYTQGRVGIGITTPTAGLDLLHNDGLLARGTIGTGATAINGAGTRLLWNPNKAAFRAGQVTGTQWDHIRIGTHSGSIGLNNLASGASSMAFGEGLNAPSRGEVVLGAYNALFPATAPTGFSTDDAALTVGIGTANTVRRDAFVVLKSGESYFNGSLDIRTPPAYLGTPSNPFGASLYVLNNGPSFSGSFVTNTATNTFPTLFARTIGTGSTIQAENLNANNTATTLYVYNNGLGRSITATTLNAASPSSTIMGINEGLSQGLFVESRNPTSTAANVSSINRTNGVSIFADNIVATNASSTIYGINRGQGETIYADNVNATSTASTIWGVNRGQGETIFADNQNNNSTASTIYGLNRGLGETIYADNINTTSTASTIFGVNRGLGETVYALNTNPTNPNSAIIAFNLGLGDGVYGAGGGDSPGVIGTNYEVGNAWYSFIPATGKDAGVSGTTSNGIAGVAGYNWRLNYTDLYDSQAGYFSSVYGPTGSPAITANYTLVDYITLGGQFRKIDGLGATGTIVKDLDNKPVLMTCVEAPEVLFSDYGRGQMENGTAYITLDPIFTKNIVVDENNHMKVFIQLEGDCKGVYVTNKTEIGFEVKELQGGNSTVDFSYMVTANRANQQSENGITIPFDSSTRFAEGPTPRKLSIKKSSPSELKEDKNPKSEHLKELKAMQLEMMEMRAELKQMQEERRKREAE